MNLQNKWHQVLILYAAVFILWAIIEPTPRQFDFINFAGLLGAAFGIAGVGLLISHIPAGIFHLKHGVWPAWQIWLAAPVMAVFMYMAYEGISYEGSTGLTSDSYSSAYRFSDPQCR